MVSVEELDKWIELTKTCQYLPENDLKVYKKISYDFYNVDKYGKELNLASFRLFLEIM